MRAYVYGVVDARARQVPANQHFASEVFLDVDDGKGEMCIELTTIPQCDAIIDAAREARVMLVRARASEQNVPLPSLVTGE